MIALTFRTLLVICVVLGGLSALGLAGTPRAPVSVAAVVR